MGAALAAWQAKGKESKVVHWLRACSSRILHYGAIFEIFQNHHPEYVSLAYGAFKFLFVVSQRPIYTAVDGLSPSAALPCANDTGPRF
jgi:hypothetical protein